MKYKKEKNKLIVYDKENFNPQHILECGQVFCFDKVDDKYIVFPQDKYAEIIEKDDCYIIKTKDVDYFEDYFDMKNDYEKIKKNLAKYDILKNPLRFGYGIRILNQDLFETLISFIISANNNIKRIKLILNNLRKNLGKEVECGVYSFPTYERLKDCDEEFFKKIGAGYRSSYLVKVLKQTSPSILKEKYRLNTSQLRNYLISLSGIGPKVADCILLFGYKKGDVFPVDTWINQMYNQFYRKEDNRERIRKMLVEEFGNMSGYAQQYLFYFQRSGQNLR